MSTLQQPSQSILHYFQNSIAIFDSGMGSYSVVKAVQKTLPNIKIVYLADRASFPYGKMPLKELQQNIQSRLDWLTQTFSPIAIIVASNTPSVTVLDYVHSTSVLLGVYPPIEAAIHSSSSKEISVLGTKGMVESTPLNLQIQTLERIHSVKIRAIEASSLIESMETFQFLNDPIACKLKLKQFFEGIFRQLPCLDTVTLSSTHLSFLKPFIQELYPHMTCLDPADDVAYTLKQSLEKKRFVQRQTNNCEDSLLVLSTENSLLKLAVKDFETGLEKLGCVSKVYSISIPNLSSKL